MYIGDYLIGNIFVFKVMFCGSCFYIEITDSYMKYKNT